MGQCDPLQDGLGSLSGLRGRDALPKSRPITGSYKEVFCPMCIELLIQLSSTCNESMGQF